MPHKAAYTVLMEARQKREMAHVHMPVADLAQQFVQSLKEKQGRDDKWSCFDDDHFFKEQAIDTVLDKGLKAERCDVVPTMWCNVTFPCALAVPAPLMPHLPLIHIVPHIEVAARTQRDFRT